MNYFEEPQMMENECQFCGWQCTGTYCSIECEVADIQENCRE